MNIALFTDTYLPEINGVATSTANLASILTRNGHNVLVVTTNPFSKETEVIDNTLRVPGIELKKIYGYRMSWIYNNKAMKIIRRFKPEVIHVQTEFGIGQFGFIVAASLKIPAVYTYHTMYEDYAYYITKGHFDQFIRKILRGYTKSSMERRVSEIIIPSVKTKDYFRQIGVDGHINVIPTGIDFSKFDKSNIDFDAIKAKKEELGIKEDEFVLLSLGRVAKEKSIDVTIRGFKQYVDEHPEQKIKFVIVGGGPALDELIKLSEECGVKDKVIFIGPVTGDNVPFHYYLGDAFVSASITETQGLTFMEAMISSLPVLARFDANLIGVIEDNVTGMFFVDENDMANKLDRLIHMSAEKRGKMIEAARKQIDGYSIDTFYKNVIGVYNRAVKKNW